MRDAANAGLAESRTVETQRGFSLFQSLLAGDYGSLSLPNRLPDAAATSLLRELAALPEGASARIEVACDDRGPTYAVYAEGGEIEDSGADWSPLVRRLETVLGGETDAVSVIWP